MANRRFIGIMGIVGLAGAVLLALAPMVIPAKTSYCFYLMFWILMASSFNIIYGFTGYLPFGYVAFYGVGSYMAAITWSRFGLPIILGIPLGGMTGVALSLIFTPTLRLRGIYFAIVNFSCAMALRILVANLPDSWTGGSLGISFSAVYDPVTSYYIMLGLMIAAVWTMSRVSTSRLGIALRSIREDPEAAEVLGINVPKSRLKAWMLAALFPSMGGAVEAWYTGIIDPDSSFHLMITTKTVVYSMFGGLGTVAGPVLGALGMHALDDVIWSRFPLLNLLILGIVIIVLVLFVPKGVMGTLLGKYPALRRYIH